MKKILKLAIWLLAGGTLLLAIAILTLPELRTFVAFKLAPSYARNLNFKKMVRFDRASVYLLGTIHEDHLTSGEYSLLHLKAVIENLHPDLLLLEQRPQMVAEGYAGDGPIEMPFAHLTALEMSIPVDGIDWWKKGSSIRRTDANRDDRMYRNLQERIPAKGTVLVLCGYSHVPELIERMMNDRYVEAEISSSRRDFLFDIGDSLLSYPPGMKHAIAQRVYQEEQNAKVEIDPAWKSDLLTVATSRRKFLSVIEKVGERKVRIPCEPSKQCLKCCALRSEAEQLVRKMTLPSTLENQRADLAKQVILAFRMLEDFARTYGWTEHLRLFFDGGIEIYTNQNQLLSRLRNLFELPGTVSMPSSGLAAALKKNILMAVQSKAYQTINPEYAKEQGSWMRLLAREMAHRLHVEILRGDEQAMRPVWFYEGFASVASKDLLSDPLDHNEAFLAIQSKGPGAYKRYAAALRYFMTQVTLNDMISKAANPDFEDWLQKECKK
ncbi:MAG: hypothetical protein JRF33_07640 [Deltaproteobacteria bacterium]|nr:hypothetical protein [Deltaproteobacteria bacterium]